MGVTDTPSAQLCLLTRSVLALAEPSHTVLAAAMHSAQASLSRVHSRVDRACGSVEEKLGCRAVGGDSE
eukprot:1321420-Pyramimonas_sp.AAC.1